MADIVKDGLIDDLEITLDFLTCESVENIFFGELLDRKADLLEALIERGGEEYRFKIQMIDEVIGLREEIYTELKSRKSEME